MPEEHPIIISHDERPIPEGHGHVASLGETAIELKYKALGGANYLGQPVTEIQKTPDGRGFFCNYQGGAIYWSLETDAHEIHGWIGGKWLKFGAEKSVLGYPITDEIPTPDGKGRFNHFQWGSIYWYPDLGVSEVHGAIQVKWSQLGWERSLLGYPVTDEMITPDGKGRFNHFQWGSIYWTPETGAHGVQGAIREKWKLLGWERSLLGYPITDEMVTPDGHGRYNHFQHGSIYWSPETGAYEVHGEIREKWKQLGWEKSALGYPITDETITPDKRGRFTHFQHGSIYWSPETRAHEVREQIREKWKSVGWEAGFLGYPLSDETDTGDGRRMNRFQGGTIYSSQGRTYFATNYTINLENFEILRTRSLHEDTNYAALSVTVEGKPPVEISKFMGDVNDGVHFVNLSTHIEVEEGKKVNIAYIITNKGHSEDPETYAKDLSKVATEIATKVKPEWGVIIGAVGKILDEVFGIIFANCDGVVAADKFEILNNQLLSFTKSRSTQKETLFYPGTDSATGCGRNSKYNVTWSIVPHRFG